jgi:hypothetical protein
MWLVAPNVATTVSLSPKLFFMHYRRQSPRPDDVTSRPIDESATREAGGRAGLRNHQVQNTSGFVAVQA